MSALSRLLILMGCLACGTCCAQAEPEVTGADRLLDLNGDGRQDVFLEYQDDGGYVESFDSNFDGDIDMNCMYLSSNVLVTCKYDTDFNNSFETSSDYDNGTLVQTTVDVDQNGLVDIFFVYLDGQLKSATRYYGSETEGARIGKVEFEFGYPLEEIYEDTDETEAEFSKRLQLRL
ncbi:MAG: hypothetical protein AAFY15_00360 [Cyanobacteria bacterium J06648_11]